MSELNGVIYECVRCGYKTTKEKWEMLNWKCPNCLYKVARKVRSPIVKRIKAV